MKKRNLLLLLLLMIFLQSCLTTEYKKYIFELNKDNSGKVTVLFANICNSSYGENDNMTNEEAFETLLSELSRLDEKNEEFSKLTPISTRLFEKDDQLWGEVVFEFDSLSEVGLFQYNNKAPYMLAPHLLSHFDSLITTNGKMICTSYNHPKSIEHTGEFIFWDKKQKILELTIYPVFSFEGPPESLLYLYKASNK